MPRIDGDDAGRQIDLIKRLSFLPAESGGRLLICVCVCVCGGGERGLDFTEVVNEGGFS